MAKRTGPKKDAIRESLDALHQRLTNVEYCLTKYLEMNEDHEPLVAFIEKQKADEKIKDKVRETTI